MQQLNERLDYIVTIRLNGEQLGALNEFAAGDQSSRTRVMRMAIDAGLTVMNAEKEALAAQRRFNQLVLGD